MVREKGFDAGKLLEGEQSDAAQETKAVLGEKPPRREIDPSIVDKLIEFRGVDIGSTETDPDARKKALLERLDAYAKLQNSEISPTALEIIEHDFFTVGEPGKVWPVAISVADLGFPNGATITEILERAMVFGLEPAPAELGPNLRMEYDNQPPGEMLAMGMLTYIVDGRDSLFYLSRSPDGSQVLSAVQWTPGSPRMQRPDTLFVFIKPRGAA